MSGEFINLNPENLADEHLCCIIRTRKEHSGIEAKKKWLAERLPEGHVFRKLNIKGCAFIEYAPIEKAWVPITGENYLYIYCLWVQGSPKGHGYGRELMEYCIHDARQQGKDGICMLGAKKQKNWLSNQQFARKYGFEKVDSTEDGYELLALSFEREESGETQAAFRGTVPQFTEAARRQEISSRTLTIYYDYQCPYVFQRIERLKEYCKMRELPADFILVDTLEQAKALPGVFNNWAVFYEGKFVTVNQVDSADIEKMIRLQK